MIVHHTKNKGDLGLLKAYADLACKGYLVLHPITEHAPFDMVAYKDGKFIRVQVKYRAANSAGSFQVEMISTWRDNNVTRGKDMDKLQVDVVCAYCPNTDECYYFDPKKNNKTFSIRIEKPKNNQLKGVHLAENFREIPLLS